MTDKDREVLPHADVEEKVVSRPVAVGLGIGLVLIASLCLAATPTLARLAYDHGSDAATVSLVRFTIAALGFVILMRVRGEKLEGRRSLLGASLIVGICYVIQTMAYLSSVLYVTVPVAVLVFFTFPVVAAVLVRFMDGVALTPIKIIAVVVAFAGVALATGASPEWPDPRGVGLALLASVATAFYIVYGAGITRRTGPIIINAFSLSIAAAFMMVNAIVFSPPALPNGTIGWLGLAASGIFFLVGILAFFSALTILDTLRATLLANSEPFFAIAIAFVILGEILTLPQAIGAALVIGGVMLPQVASRHRPKTAKPLGDQKAPSSEQV